jgi:hypothetical protein
LVWRAGFEQWQPAHRSGFFAGAAAAPAGDSQRCIVTGLVYPVAQMIQTQHGWVSAAGKEVYYQSLREGAPLPTAASLPNARRDGKRIVVPVGNARLPLRCVKTNAAVTEAEVLHKKLYWCTPVAALTILLSVLIYIILYYVLRKLVEIDIPLSLPGRRVVRRQLAIAWTLALAGIAGIIAGLAGAGLLSLLVVGLALLLTGLIYGSLKACALRVTKLKAGEAWLAGAGPEFLASLPPYA